jgi:hypothetical protein
MRGRLKEIALLCAVTAAVALGAETAAAAETATADQQATAEGVQISWEGRGEIQLAPDDHGESSLRLRLHGNVVIRGKQLVARADYLTFNMAKKVVSLESTDSGEVRLSFQMPDDGPTLEVAARKIVISLCDGRINVEGAGILSAPGKKQTQHHESEKAVSP